MDLEGVRGVVSSNPSVEVDGMVFWIPLGFVSLEHVLESIEEISAIVGASGSFGMVLHAECGNFAMPHTGDGVIVEVSVGDLQA